MKPFADPSAPPAYVSSAICKGIEFHFVEYSFFQLRRQAGEETGSYERKHACSKKLS